MFLEKRNASANDHSFPSLNHNKSTIDKCIFILLKKENVFLKERGKKIPEAAISTNTSKHHHNAAMITSSLLPLRSFPCFLPATTACRSHASATVPFPRITLGRRGRRLDASATKSSEEEAAAGSTNGSVPGLPPAEEDDDEFCPVDCVTEFKTYEEFQWYLERSKASGVLLVIDFFRPSCGSCKYIEKGFMRLCKGSRDDGAPIVFLKHNVRKNPSSQAALRGLIVHELIDS